MLKIAEYLVFDPLNRLLSGVIIALIIICAGLYINRAFQRKNRDERILLIGFACLILGWGIGSLFGYFLPYELEGFYHNHNYYYNTDNVGVYSTVYIIYLIASMLSIAIGYTVFTLAVADPCP